MTSRPRPASGPPSPRRVALGLGAVLFGAFISTLASRLSVFGLADIRGALNLGVDEAAWITTSQAAAQMMVAPLALWGSTVFGPRRILLAGCVLFGTAAALTPLAGGIRTVLVMQYLAGMGSGCFIPLVILVVLRTLPPRWWTLGVVLFALNIEASLNISASVEGFYVDHLSWKWIFWQDVPLAAGMGLCIHFGLPRAQVDPSAVRRADWLGMLTMAAGLSLVYAGLDQGDRLDWLASPLIVGLLAGGLGVLALFVLHELTTPAPWLDLRLLLGGYLPVLLLLVCEVRFAGLGTAFLVPQFLGAVRGFRSPEIGEVLVWIALPQLVAAPLAVGLMRLFDPRWLAFLGVALIGAACWITSTHLTAQWSASDFLATQLMQALGQTLAISSAIFIGALNLRPASIPTFGVMLQVARLLGGEAGIAFMATFVRHAEQTASNVFGGHVESGALDTVARLQSVAGWLAGREGGPGLAGARSLGVLFQGVRAQANLEACVEGFAMVAISSVVAFVLLLAFDVPPRGPASPGGLRERIRRGRA